MSCVLTRFNYLDDTEIPHTGQWILRHHSLPAEAHEFIVEVCQRIACNLEHEEALAFEEEANGDDA